MTASVQPAPPGRELCPTRAGAAPQPFWRPLPPSPRLLVAPGAAALPQKKRPALQARRAVAEVHDPAEREAEQLALTLLAERQPGPRAPEAPLRVAQTRPLPVDPELVPDSGEPLAQSARRELEARLGYGLQAVRIHRSSAAARLADQHRAEAYTAGPHIVFAAGRYAPQNPDGKRLLLHELVHVVQQGHAAPISPRLAITARPAAGLLLRDAAPQKDSAKAPQAPEKTAAPVEVPLDLTYVSQRPLRSSIPGNDYLDHAAQFYPSKGRVDNFLELFRSIYSKLPQAKVSDKARLPKRAYVRELTLVVHGWPNGDILFGIDHRDRSKTNFPEALPAVRSQLQADDSRKEVYAQVCSAMDKRTRVILRACRIGGNLSALTAFGTLFGGKATVFAPRVYSFFEAQLPVAISYFAGQEPPAARNRTGPIVFASRKLIERILQESGRQAKDDFDLVALCTPVLFEKNGQAVANVYFLPTSYLAKNKNPTLSDAAALRQNSHFIPITSDTEYWGHSTPESEPPAQSDSAVPAVPGGAEAHVPAIAAPAEEPKAAEPVQLLAPPSSAPAAELATQPDASAAALQTSKEADLVSPTSQAAEETEPAPAPLQEGPRLSSEREWLHQKAAILHNGSPGDFAAVQKEVYERLAKNSPSEVRALAGFLSDPPGTLLRALLRDVHLLDVQKYRPQLAEILAVTCTVLPDYLSTPFASALVQEVLKPRALEELPVQWVVTYARAAAAVASADKDIFKEKQYTYGWFQTLYVALPEAEREKFLDRGGNKLQQLLWAKLSQGERETLGLNLIDPQSAQKLRLKIREQILAAQDPQQAAADPVTQTQRQRLLLLLASTVGDSLWAKEQLPVNDKDFANTLLIQRALDKLAREPSSGRHSVANLAKVVVLRLENLDLASLPGVLDILAGVRFTEAGPKRNVGSLRKTGDFETRNGKSKLVKTRGINVDIPGLDLASISVPLGAGKLQTGAANFGHIGIDFLKAGTKAAPEAQIDVAIKSIDIKELVYLSPGFLIAVGDTKLEGSAGKNALVFHATLVGPGPQDSDEILQSGLIEKFFFSLFKGLASALTVAMGIVQVSSLGSNLIEKGQASLDLDGKATLSVVETSKGIGVDKAEVMGVKAGLGEKSFFSLVGIDLFGVHGVVSAEKLGVHGLRADTNRSVLSKLLDPATLRELVQQSVVAGEHSHDDVQKAASAEVKSAPKSATANIDSINAQRLRFGDVPEAKELQKDLYKLLVRRQQLQGYLPGLDIPRGLINEWATSVERGQSLHAEQLRLKPGRRNLEQRGILADQIRAIEKRIGELREALTPSGFGGFLKVTEARKALQDRTTAIEQRITQVDEKIVEVIDREAQRVEYQRLLALPKLSAKERQELDTLRRAFRSPIIVEALDLKSIELSVGLSQDGAPQERYERSVLGVTATVAALDVSGLPAERLALILRGRYESLVAVATAKVRALTPIEEQQVETLKQALADYKKLQDAIELVAPKTPLTVETFEESALQQRTLREKRQALIDWSRAVVLRVRGLKLTAQLQLGDLLSDDVKEAAPPGTNAIEKLSRVDRLLGGGVHADLSLPKAKEGKPDGIKLVQRTKDGERELATVGGTEASFDVGRSGKDIYVNVRKVSIEALKVAGIAWSGGKDQSLAAGESGLSNLDIAATLWLYDSGDIHAEIKSLKIDELYATGLHAKFGKTSFAVDPNERARLRGIRMHNFIVDRYDDESPLKWSGSLSLRTDGTQSALEIPRTFVETTLGQVLQANAMVSAGSLVFQKNPDGSIAAAAEDVAATADASRGKGTVKAASLGVRRASYSDDGQGNKTVKFSLDHLTIGKLARYVAGGGLTLDLGAGSTLKGLRVDAQLHYKYDALKERDALQAIEFPTLSIDSLTVHDGRLSKGTDLGIGLPLGIFNDLHLLGCKIEKDQLGHLRAQGQLDLRGGLYAEANGHTSLAKDALSAAGYLAANQLQVKLKPDGTWIIDRLRPKVLGLKKLALHSEGDMPLDLNLDQAAVKGLDIRRIELRPGKGGYVDVSGLHSDSINFAAGIYKGPVLWFAGDPIAWKQKLRYQPDSFKIRGHLGALDVGHARMNFDKSLILENLNLAELGVDLTQESVTGDELDRKEASKTSINISTQGFAAKFVSLNLSQDAEEKGLITDLKGVQIRPGGLLAFARTKKTDEQGAPGSDGNLVSNQSIFASAQINPLALEPYEERGQRYFKLSTPGKEPVVDVSGLSISDVKSDALSLYLSKAQLQGPILITPDFKSFKVGGLDLKDATLNFPQTKDEPRSHSPEEVAESIANTEELLGFLDPVKLAEGEIDLGVMLRGRGKFLPEAYGDKLGIKKGMIKIPTVNPSKSQLVGWIHDTSLALGFAVAKPPLAVLDALVNAGFWAAGEYYILRSLVLKGALKLSDEELKHFIATREMPYGRLVHAILDDSPEPGDPVPVALRINDSKITIPSQGKDKKRTIITQSGFSAEVDKDILLRLSGGVDLSDSTGTIRAQLDGALSNIRYRDTAFEIGAGRIGLDNLSALFLFNKKKSQLMLTLKNLLLRDFSFQLNGPRGRQILSRWHSGSPSAPRAF